MSLEGAEFTPSIISILPLVGQLGPTIQLLMHVSCSQYQVLMELTMQAMFRKFHQAYGQDPE